jgi:hypothetical protein
MALRSKITFPGTFNLNLREEGVVTVAFEAPNHMKEALQKPIVVGGTSGRGESRVGSLGDDSSDFEYASNTSVFLRNSSTLSSDTFPGSIM